MMMRWLDSKLRHKAWYRRWRGLPEPVSCLTIAYITREALAMLESQLTFTADVNRIAGELPSGGKLTIRRPQRYANKP